MSNILIQRLAIVFGAPTHSEDPAAYIQELTKLLKAYTHPELDKAADMLIREFRPTTKKPWPTPSQICVAAADARDLLYPAPKAEKAHPAWQPKAVEKADKLIQGQMGQEAGDNGWVLSLHDFCRNHGRLPNEADAYRCRVDAQEFNEAYGKASRSDLPTVRALATGIGDAMLRKRDLLSNIAYGEIIDRKQLASGEREE